MPTLRTPSYADTDTLGLELPYLEGERRQLAGGDDEALGWLDMERETPDRAWSPQAEAETPRRRTPRPPPQPGFTGALWSYTSTPGAIRTAIYVPTAATGRDPVDVLLYIHGLIQVCGTPRTLPEGLISVPRFNLAGLVDASKRPLVIIAPQLQGAARDAKWSKHGLDKPAAVNALVADALAEIGRKLNTPPPGIGALIVAGHSRAYGVIYGLIRAQASPDFTAGAMAKLSAIWALDATYNFPGDPYPRKELERLAASRPGLRIEIAYRKPSSTDRFGKVGHAGAIRLRPVSRKILHCDVPRRCLPDLLATPAGAGQGASEWEATLDEQMQDLVAFDVQDEDSLLLAEHQRERLWEEAGEREQDEWDEASEDESPGVGYSRSRVAFEDQPALSGELDFHQWESDEEAAGEDLDDEYAYFEGEWQPSGKQPLAVPPARPVPFAALPPDGSFWPIKTSVPNWNEVAFIWKIEGGKAHCVGRSGRTFLARRSVKQNGPKIRWHVGVDLFAKPGDVVVACEAGRILRFGNFYKAKSGQQTMLLLIQHPGSGVIVNYGEVTSDSLKRFGLKVGAQVSAGQEIGIVSDTKMVHFETYKVSEDQADNTNTIRWMQTQKTPPERLLNPTRYLLRLVQNGRRRA